MSDHAPEHGDETTRPLSLEELEGEGGDPACWAHLLCPECGVMLGEGDEHAEGCQWSEASTA